MRKLMMSKKLSVVLAIAIVGVSAFIVYAVLSFSPPGKPFPEEALFLDHYAVESAPGQPSPTILTLWVGNSATNTATLVSLTVTDSAGGGQASFQLSGPDVPPGAATVVSLTVDTAGTGFYFIAGHSYTVILVTARGTQAGFTVNYS